MNTDVSLEIGSSAPDFRGLPGVDGSSYSLDSFDDTAVLAVVFLANGCPTVKGYEGRLRSIQEVYARAGVKLVGINSNNPYVSPRDAFPEMVRRARESSFNFPYLKDMDRSVAEAYGAIATPHVFVFDAQRRLRYRGRIDDSRDPSRVTRHHLRDAVDALLRGDPVEHAETEPAGCAIVW